MYVEQMYVVANLPRYEYASKQPLSYSLFSLLSSPLPPPSHLLRHSSRDSLTRCPRLRRRTPGSQARKEPYLPRVVRYNRQTRDPTPTPTPSPTKKGDKTSPAQTALTSPLLSPYG